MKDCHGTWLFVGLLERACDASCWSADRHDGEDAQHLTRSTILALFCVCISYAASAGAGNYGRGAHSACVQALADNSSTFEDLKVHRRKEVNVV